MTVKDPKFVPKRLWYYTDDNSITPINVTDCTAKSFYYNHHSHLIHLR